MISAMKTGSLPGLLLLNRCVLSFLMAGHSTTPLVLLHLESLLPL